MVTGSPFLSLTPLLFIVEPFSAISTMRRSVYLRRRSLPGRMAVHYLTDKVSSYLYPLPPSYVRSWDGDGERWYVIVRFFYFVLCASLLRLALCVALSFILFASSALASNLRINTYNHCCFYTSCISFVTGHCVLDRKSVV